MTTSKRTMTLVNLALALVLVASACAQPPAVATQPPPTAPAAMPTTPPPTAAAAMPTTPPPTAPTAMPTTPPTTAPTAMPTTPPTTATAAPYTLTIWWWGETEAPGAKAWLDESVALYKKDHPNVSFDLVLQNIDTVVPGFRAAAAAKSGPDIQYFWTYTWIMEDVWAGNIAPISDYVPPAELSHWLDTGSRTYDGKVYSMPWYMAGYVLYYNKALLTKAGLDPAKVPVRWDDWIAYLEAVKKAGITPICAGMKDGYTANQFGADMSNQTVDSNQEFKQIVVGNGKYTDPRYATWWTYLAQLVKAGYFNSDANSIPAYERNDKFGRGECAYNEANTGFAKQFETNLGDDKLGVMKMPRFADAKLADGMSMNASGGLGITPWSTHKQEAADFLVFLHTADRIQSWWTHTGVPFADDRMDISTITDPVVHQILAWAATRPVVGIEGFMPTQVWEQGYIAGGQYIFQGGTPEKAAQMMQDAVDAWTKSNPPDLPQWVIWAKAP